MASSSSVVSLINANQLDRPVYNIMAVQNRDNDMAGALSSVPADVLLTEDVTAFIHSKQEELGETFIESEYLSLWEDRKLQSKYAKLESSRLINGVKYPTVF